MVDTAQQNVKANAEEQEQQINVQRLLEKETKHIKVWPVPSLSHGGAFLWFATLHGLCHSFRWALQWAIQRTLPQSQLWMQSTFSACKQ